jgi:PAS domain S-box-containing protein
MKFIGIGSMFSGLSRGWRGDPSLQQISMRADALPPESEPARPTPAESAEAEAVLGDLAAVFLDALSPSPTRSQSSNTATQPESNEEEETAKRQTLYQVLIEQIPAVVFIAYLEGGTMGEAYVSPQIEKVLGFTQEEWLEDPIRWYRHIHPDDKDRWSVEAANMFLTGESLRSAYRVIARDGTMVWFQCEIRMVRRENGRPWFIHGVGFDITELKRTEAALHARTAALHELSSRLLRTQDEERRRIARELHDSLGQYLAAVKINLDLLAGETDTSNPFFSESKELVDRCIGEVRTISHLLHPPLLDEMGFLSAAQWFVEGFAKRSGIKVTVDIPPDLQRLPDAIEIALFRVLQETLTNVHRHSRSLAAEILLAVNNGEVFLEVRDHGSGVPPDVLERFQQVGSGAGVGLAGMRERVHELGGRLEIRSDQHGTIVSVTIPVRPI